ncbi:MAG: hypothetical protein FWF77_00480, partial [Defluviitaleaceae bacterium]|nr:hypothetical protein [Defluviitaleaceae bacterium]
RIDPDALRPYRAWINNSWRAVPRINANNAGTHQIRLHPTARISGGAWSGNAASETGTLHTAWGEIGRDSRGRPIMGVTRAVITAYGETPPPVAPPSAPPPYAEIPDATTPPAVQMNSTTDPALQMDVVTEEDLPVDVDVTTEAAVQIE